MPHFRFFSFFLLYQRSRQVVHLEVTQVTSMTVRRDELLQFYALEDVLNTLRFGLYFLQHSVLGFRNGAPRFVLACYYYVVKTGIQRVIGSID